MSGFVKLTRVIRARGLDGRWGHLDTSVCKSVEGYAASVYYRVPFLHKTPNKRWYAEEFNSTAESSTCRELTIDQAMDWLEEHTYSDLSGNGFLERLPDVTKTPIPAHGGEIVVKCLTCRALSRIPDGSRSKICRSQFEREPFSQPRLSHRDGCRPWRYEMRSRSAFGLASGAALGRHRRHVLALMPSLRYALAGFPADAGWARLSR